MRVISSVGRLASILAVVHLLTACSDDPGEDSGPDEPGACGMFGVKDAVAIPDSCPLQVGGDGETVRVFAVGQLVRFREMTDYAAFCRTWDDVVRTQVLPCLAEDKPNLLVFPENAALAAAFIGSRGEISRAATTTMGGFLPFASTYAEPFAFYGERYPDVPGFALLLLSMSDTLHRAFQTFPAIARTYGVHVAVSADLAPAELTSDPAAVQALADPDLDDVSEVWLTTEPATYNWGIFFDPAGEELARIAKVYLVPDEEDLLMLRHGDLADMRPVALPFAPAGMVISKDAWMPDVLQRLDALGAPLMLQPEAFSGWGVVEYEGDWLPDIVKQAGWGHTQRHAAMQHNVTPCIKGNLLDLVYDCQSHITRDARPGQTPMSFIGQPADEGFVAIEPWVAVDPGEPATLEERRATLADTGRRLAPGSGDALEDQYVNQVLAADLSFAADGRTDAYGDGAAGVLGASRVVLPATGTHQRFPAVAADGSRLVVAFSEGELGGGAVRVAVSDDGGATFTTAAFFDALATGPRRRTPAVALAGDRILVAWEEEDAATGDGTVEAAVTLDGGASWSTSRVAGTGAQAWAPAAAVDSVTGAFHVAWLDLRLGGRPKPWLASSADGASWAETWVDPANDRDDNPRGDAAFVQVAARGGQVHVAFLDFRLFAWDVFLASSADGGATFGWALRVNPGASQLQPASGGPAVEAERLHSDVQLALAADGTPLVSWADLQDRRVDTHASLLSGTEVVRMDDAPDRVDAFRPSFTVLPGGAIAAAWQDLRSGASRIRLAARPATGGAFGASAVVDDAAEAAHTFRPRLAPTPGGVAVVWEDWRSGQGVVRVASGTLP